MNDNERIKILDLRPLNHDRLFDVHELNILAPYREAALKPVNKSRRVNNSACLNDAHNILTSMLKINLILL